MVSSIKTAVSNSPFSDEIPGLLQSHLDHLQASGIFHEAIRQRGYESVLGHKRLKDLGFGRQQCRTTGMLIPLWGVDGHEIVGYQFRPDNPRLNSKGKPIKYENPRGISVRWEGSLVNMVIAMAAGDQEIGAEFSEYIKPGADEPEAVTPSMVARQLKSSVKAITQALTSVGFQVEKRWITLHKEAREVKKQVRAYTVPDSRTWSEITSRYYYAEDGNLAVEIPQCLQSSKYAPSAEASHPSQVSQKVSDQHGLVTVETVVTREKTQKKNDDKKPTNPCTICGSYNWWRRNGSGWLCGRCHPEPQGEELFMMGKYGNGEGPG